MLITTSAISHPTPDLHATLEPNSIQTRFGRRLRKLRQERGWTQCQMAMSTGMDRGHICDLERGRKTVSIRTMEALARCLKIDLSEMLRDV